MTDEIEPPVFWALPYPALLLQEIQNRLVKLGAVFFEEDEMRCIMDENVLLSRRMR
jgi:hypothetical protein